jgi:murein DD-endopeptidase MepM/ murein hydrolase activator NlpD
MLRTSILSLVLLLILLPVEMIETTGASQSNAFDRAVDQDGELYSLEAAQPCNDTNGFALPLIDDNPSDNLRWQATNGFGNYVPELGGFHPGEDWNLVGGDANADLGKPVYAIASGMVEKVSNLSGLGFLVALKHTGVFTIPGKSGTVNGQPYSYPTERVNTIYSIYVHITNVTVNQGDCVQTGAVLGYIMNPGRGPHVHLEIRHPNAVNSSNWSLVGSPSNWAAVSGGYTGYYLNPQAMVDGGVRHPRDFIAANAETGGQPRGQASVSPDCGPPGTLFELQWTGFTPNRTLTSHLRKPDGTEFPPLQFNTDSQGNVLPPHIVDSTGFTTGTYQHWAVDDATGGMSNVVSFDVRPPLSGDVSAITFGQNVPMFLGHWESRDFGFCARAGDRLNIRFDGRPPQLTLTDEAGTILAVNNGSPARIDYTLLISGNFRILAMALSFSGIYGLNIQRVNNPGLSTRIACGETSLVFLNELERHTHTFSGNAGNRVTITMSRGVIGNIVPFLELYDPDGRPLAIQPGGTTVTISGITLTKTGRYTILTSSSPSTSGPYTISLQCQ